jgi:hypothetical protein
VNSTTLIDHVIFVTLFYENYTIIVNSHSLTTNKRLSETGAIAEQPSIENFKYTTDSPLLSYSQRNFYEENGYLVIPRLVEDELIEECR